MENSIYGPYRDILPRIKDDFTERIRTFQRLEKEHTGYKICEHLLSRVKSEESMRQKLEKRGLKADYKNALTQIKDSIGIRIVCDFIDDIYKNVENLKNLSGVSVHEEKDYIHHAKPNGYRSYHMILVSEEPFGDVYGNTPGEFFIEVQLRTIAMDTWAALEHQIKYKKLIKNQNLITGELKRCADELASCDLSMQTLRNLIRESE